MLKRIILFLVLMVFLVSTSVAQGSNEAKINFYQSKIAKIENHVKTLQGKLKKVKGRNAKAQKAKLSKLIAKEKKRIVILSNQLQNEVALNKQVEETPSMKVIEAPAAVIQAPEAEAIPKLSKYVIGVGYAGGAGLARLEYVQRLGDKFELRPEVGVGVGNNYYIMDLKMACDMKINETVFIGLSADVANYSLYVQGIPGLPETIDKGLRVGAGVLLGMNVDKFEVQAGYSMALGVFVSGGYYF